MSKRKRNLCRCTHPFDACPFEAFYLGSWKSVACLRIRAGTITMLVVDGGDVFEENVSISNLRIRSRKATWSDCIFLRPGLDVCVLSTSQLTESSSEEKNLEPIWFVAQINSIERKPHEPKCSCQFYVKFYVTQDPLGAKMTTLSKDTTMVQIDQMSILQKLQSNPSENEYYCWDFSEDYWSSLQKYKLLTGKFLSDLSWLLVASVVKQVEFDVRSIGNRIVYQILGDDCDQCSNAINFKSDNESSVPIVVSFTLSDVLEKGTGCDMHDDEPLSYYDLMGLRRSKRRCVQPERYLGCGDLLESDIDVARVGTYKTYRGKYDESDERVHSCKKYSFENLLACQSKIKSSREVKLEISNRREHQPQIANQRKHQSQRASVCLPDGTDQMIHKEEDPLDAQIPGTYSGDIGENLEGGRERKRSHKKLLRKSDYSICSDRGIFHNTVTNRKRSFSASVCREMIKTCMENVKSTIKKEQPLAIDQWKEIRAANLLNQRDINDMPSMDEEENSEIEMLWKEMELSTASTYLLDDSVGSNVEVPAEVARNTSTHCGHTCQHEYKLNEEIGIICQLCGFVSTEIKDVSPTFLKSMSWIPIKRSRNNEDSESKVDEGEGLDLFGIAAASNMPLSEREDNVWALIPDLKRKLHFHQKQAFEFLWRNIAGSLVPELMEPMLKKRGGCVISHSPGAGKTLLIIAFLASYLKLFPGSRPLVLAPKTTLYTWYKEVNKWEISIPVYQIHGLVTYRGEVLKQKLRISPQAAKHNQDVMHYLDCMEKIQKWLAQPSVLLMGYTSFLTLTREDSKFAHKNYMGKVLWRSPGILILDEGHNPRSTKSRLRKALMKVETGLRILLSGTLFQNNFKEYFNTLTLARPSFVSEVLRKLDPKFKRRKRSVKTHFSLENRARKFFVDKIAKKIDSGVAEERMQGLNMLRNLTSGFIDVYEGGSSENLPGLQCYTLMMKLTPYQQELLLKLQGQRPLHKGFSLESELLITLASIHPWLIRTTASANQYFSKEELERLEKYKLDIKSGSKVRFVMSLVPGCIIRREKILIFCRNIAPINLFLDIFESFYGWRKGEEVLVLQGDIELFERGRIMDKFDEPGGASKVMLASITACAEGISLTAASRVILLDSEWNPSKRKQAIARAFRPGQSKIVYVYQLLAAGSLEEEKYSRTTWKERVSSMIFSEELVEDPSQWQADEIEDDILREIVEEDRATLFHKIMKNEKASNGVVQGKE